MIAASAQFHQIHASVLVRFMSVDDPDPARLIAKARAGDRDSLGELLDLYRHYLKLMVRLQLGRRLEVKLDASDVVQETFLEAHKNFMAFQGTTEAELIGWLRKILAARLANIVRMYCGSLRRNIRLERQLAQEMEQSSRAFGDALPNRQSSPSGSAIRRERAVLLANALERLPDHYRDVIVMNHVEGLDFGEIARRMGRTESSVKHIWTRALARLKHLLKELK
jgi:RNA polymerase sigma-70 factor (ECF subfamily)